MASTVWNRVAKTTGAIVAAMCVVVPGAVVAATGPTTGATDIQKSPDVTAVVPTGDAVPGEYVVMLRPATAAQSQPRAAADSLSTRIDSVLGRLGDRRTRGAGQAVTTSDDPVIAELAIIDGFAARLSASQAAVLATFDEVLSVEQNVRIQRPPEPASVGPGELPWGLDRVDQQRLPLDGSYTPPGDGAGVTAYVIDSGVRVDHHEFGNRVKPMVDLTSEGLAPEAVDPSCLSHGTHVAATIAGTNVGVAPGATVQPVRVLGCQEEFYIDILRGMDWVAQHATLPAVVNMSLGLPLKQSWNSATRYLTAKGITVVVAAGNESADACATSPASEPSAITVGATTSDDFQAGFSNYGPCVDVNAPGVDVLSAGVAGPDDYALSNGTSMASPHVAGVAALYLSAHPAATPDAVERAIVDGAAVDVLGGVKPTTPNRLLQVNGLPNPVNRPDTDPVAYIAPPVGAGPIPINTTVTLDGQGSFDPVGGMLTYEWRVEGQDGVASTKPTLTTTVSAVGLFEVTLKVTNSSGVSATATIQLSAFDPNPPVIVLDPPGNQYFAQPGEQVSIDASGSYDADGGEVSVFWYYESPQAEFEVTGPTFTHTFEGGSASLYVLIENEFGASDLLELLITEPYSPEAIIEPSIVNVAVGDSVLFDGSQSFDKNGPGGELVYEWRDARDGPAAATGPTYTRYFDSAGTFQVHLTVESPSGEKSKSATATVVVTPGPSAMSGVAPVRVLDTRASAPKVPGPKGAITAGGVARFTVGDIPLSAAGVVLNVTAANPSADGHLTVYPCGKRPNTSNVNYRAGVTTANAVVSLLGGQHELCVYSFASTDVVVDVTGFVPGGSAAHTVDPVRVLDTRAKLSDGPSRLRAGGFLKVPIASVADVPADASAVFVNVTAANPSANGHLTVYPCGQVPDTSNVNYRAGATKANMAVVKLATDGSLCVKSHAETDLVVDVLGFVDSGDSVALASTRKLDTRTSALGSRVEQRGPLAGGSMTKVKLDVDPAQVAGVFLSVAAVNPAGDGHLTVFPCGTRPTASVLNYRAGVTTSNMMFSKIDQTGSVCVWTHATTDLVVDFNGSVAVPT